MATRSTRVWLVRGAFFLAAALFAAGLGVQSPFAQTAQSALAQIAIDADDIGGIVTSATGPEAGVWVIAETNDLPTKFRRIVVTDDAGRYVIPDLPKANYKVWVRGYGLVDSAPVQGAPGQRLALTGVVAPNARAAAQYYPSNYWYSLLQIPSKDAFPLAPEAAAPARARAGGPADEDVAIALGTGRGRGRGPVNQGVASQAHWVNTVKSCIICHQMGNKAIRELNPAMVGKFESMFDAWEHRVLLGQNSGGNAVEQLGHRRGVSMYADWTERIMAGEVPPAPPRPAGLERNLVVTSWDFASTTSFIHDATASDKNNPGVNAYGPIYAAEWGHNSLEVLDPTKHVAYSIKVPLLDESGRKQMRSRIDLGFEPSPYWGEEVIHEEMLRMHVPYFDSRGNVWFNARNKEGKAQAFCQPGSSNPYTKYWPLPAENTTGVNYYSPKTGKFAWVETCFNTHHIQIADDPDETIFASGGGLISWVNSRVFLETGSAEKAQGWCPAIVDFNGDGKIGAYTRPPEPVEANLDLFINGGGYGVSWNPKDGSIWYASGGGLPGQVVRIERGSNPPFTCKAEIYQPPFGDKASGTEMGATPRGIDIDTNGIVWTALATTGQMASFDRSKCKVLTGPTTGVGTHCPEGWTLYPIPGPKFKGVTDQLNADFLYYNWVDRHNTLGMGANVPIATGTSSDSLLVLDPNTKQWVVLRVPYPLGFYTRGIDGRIDNPNAGWKGRGLWAADETRTVFHNEGGKGSTSSVAHFQLRPNPLAK